VAEEAEPSCFNDTRNWTAAGGLPDRSVATCRVYGIRRIFRRDHVSKASSRRARAVVKIWRDINAHIVVNIIIISRLPREVAFEKSSLA